MTENIYAVFMFFVTLGSVYAVFMFFVTLGSVHCGCDAARCTVCRMDHQSTRYLIKFCRYYFTLTSNVKTVNQFLDEMGLIFLFSDLIL
jgi:hypothetical protein